MNNPHTLAAVIDHLRDMLAELLVLEREEIAADSRLVDDLGKRFGCTLPRTSVLDHAADIAGGTTPFLSGGRLSPLGAALLQSSINAYSTDEARPGMLPGEVFSATTLRHWAQQVVAIHDALPDRCPECGFEHAVAADDGSARCGGCAARLTPPDGDSVSRRHVEAFLELQARQSA
jgi:hypothetical protein